MSDEGKNNGGKSNEGQTTRGRGSGAVDSEMFVLRMACLRSHYVGSLWHDRCAEILENDLLSPSLLRALL